MKSKFMWESKIKIILKIFVCIGIDFYMVKIILNVML